MLRMADAVARDVVAGAEGGQLAPNAHGHRPSHGQTTGLTPVLTRTLKGPPAWCTRRHPSLRSDERAPSPDIAFTIHGIRVQLQRNTYQRPAWLEGGIQTALLRCAECTG